VPVYYAQGVTKYHGTDNFFAPGAAKSCLILLLLHRALWNLYIVHSPTNELFIKLGEF